MTCESFSNFLTLSRCEVGFGKLFIETQLFLFLLLFFFFFVTTNFFTVTEKGAQEWDEEGKAEKKRARLPGILPTGQASPKVWHPEVGGIGGVVEQVIGGIWYIGTSGTRLTLFGASVGHVGPRPIFLENKRPVIKGFVRQLNGGILNPINLLELSSHWKKVVGQIGPHQCRKG